MTFIASERSPIARFDDFFQRRSLPLIDLRLQLVALAAHELLGFVMSDLVPWALAKIIGSPKNHASLGYSLRWHCLGFHSALCVFRTS